MPKRRDFDRTQNEVEGAGQRQNEAKNTWARKHDVALEEEE